MKNIFFPEEDVTENDLFFMCYMIERVSRKQLQPNRYVVNTIGKAELTRLISLADVLHSENPQKVEHDWILDYGIQEGNYDVSDVDPKLTKEVPTALQMGKVYMRLIVNTALAGEDFVDGIIRVYNNPICEVIDNYNCSAYYEPSYYMARAYNEGGF